MHNSVGPSITLTVAVRPERLVLPPEQVDEPTGEYNVDAC